MAHEGEGGQSGQIAGRDAQGVGVDQGQMPVRDDLEGLAGSAGAAASAAHPTGR